MSSIFPIPQNFPLVDKAGNYTGEFKRYLDDLLTRVGGIRGGLYGQLADGAVITWDLDKYPHAAVVLGGNRTIANPINAVAGSLWQPYTLAVVQDATGSRTLAWGSAYKFPGGTAPTLSTGANAVDQFAFTSDGSSMLRLAQALDLR